MRLKYKIFLQGNTKFSLQKVLVVLSFGSCPNRMSVANIVAEIQFKIFNERALSTGEPCTCEYVAFLESIHRGTLTFICIKWVPGDSSTIFLATIFTQKISESPGSTYSSILMLENV